MLYGVYEKNKMLAPKRLESVYEKREIVIYYDGDINMEFRANYQSGIEGSKREECGGRCEYEKKRKDNICVYILKKS